MKNALRGVQGYAIGFLLALVWLASAALPASAAARPNFIVIIADDYGSGHYGQHQRQNQIPNLERLAQMGMRYTAGHAYQACVITRAAFQSGRRPELMGIGIDGNGPQPLPSMVTIAERLRPLGYWNALVGKWHLHMGKGRHPLDSGYNAFTGVEGKHPSYFGHDATAPLFNQRKVKPNVGLITDTLGVRAVEVIKKRTGVQPFFLVVAFTAPHDPLQGTLLQRVKEMDANIGRILDAVDMTNTYVVFFGDNGRAGEPGYKDGKYSSNGGGVLVPFLLAGPGIPAGATSSDVVSVIDFMPTFLHAATGVVPGADVTDGISLLLPIPLDRTLYWDGIKGEQGGRTLRQGKWHYQRDMPGKPIDQLWDVHADPHQLVNVAASNPELVAQFRAMLDHW